jgi:small-conductance mechanosensitive channel/CRP-like cAMP-binding protein
VTAPETNKKLIASLVGILLVGLAIYVQNTFDWDLRELLRAQLGGMAAQADTIVNIVRLVLFGLLIFFVVRAFGFLIFGVGYRFRRGYEAPSLIRNVFSIIAFTALFLLIFTFVFPAVDLGALFTTSALFGVILGLALQDTLGNFFSGISLQADRPFQVGDVITVGTNQITGVVEEITWRAIKIRTFQNHIVVISNSTAAKESIQVSPRDNLNARLIFFNTLYTDSPAKTIHAVREAVRDADNVSQKITPIVRMRNLGDNGPEYEVKYWLEDYAKYNDTDAMLRQRIWYAFRRAGLNFAYPTRTLFVDRSAKQGIREGVDEAILERLSAVDIFEPLSTEETAMLAHAAAVHVFAPDEHVIHAGEPGSSMFVVHRGKVSVQINDNGRPRTVATLDEGAFFGEMALFTGEPRSANIVADEETEVLEIGHDAMKQVFETNPTLVESLSHIIAERRQALADSEEAAAIGANEPAGILSAIKRFFHLK